MEQSSTCLWKDENEISYRIENSKENNEGEISQSEDTSHDDTRTNELNCNNESNELNSIQQQHQNLLSPSSWHSIPYIPETIQAQSRSFDDDDLRTQSHIPRKKRAYSFDPERIKRPMNSFLLFSNEIRPVLQAKYRDKSNAQISKLVGEEWHKLDDEKKKEYISKAEKIKEEFNKMYPNFVYTKRRRKRYHSTNLPQKARYDLYPNYYYYNQYINEQPYSMMHPPSIYDLESHDHFEHDYYYQSMINNSYPMPPTTHPMRHHLSSPFTFNHRHGQFHHQFQPQQNLQQQQQQQPSQIQQQPSHQQLQPEQLSTNFPPLMNQSNEEHSPQHHHQQKNDHISNITCLKDKEDMKSKLLVKEE